jgi:hypothetical protein
MFAQSQLRFFRIYFLVSQKIGINVHVWDTKTNSLKPPKSLYMNIFHRILYHAYIFYGMLISAFAVQLQYSGTSSTSNGLLNLLWMCGAISSTIFAISNFRIRSDSAQLVNEIFRHEWRQALRLKISN